MPFDGILPSVVSGKSDIGASCINVTEERAKSVLFSEPYYEELGAILYRPESIAALAVPESPQSAETDQEFSLITWVKEAFHKNLIIEDRWKLIASGLGVTMIIALMAQAVSTFLAVPGCYILTRKNRFISRLGKLYCGLIYGLPAITILLISYYIVFGHSQINPILIAVAAFSLISAADIANEFAAAMDTVSKTEIEAARAVGFSSISAFWLIVFPQALKRALPSYTVGFVKLVKSTAFVGYIAIQDMTRAADIIRSRTFDAYFPILFTALIYLVITTACIAIFKFILIKCNAQAVS
jgi:polar amino acid transport system substrate-binding protein